MLALADGISVACGRTSLYRNSFRICVCGAEQGAGYYIAIRFVLFVSFVRIWSTDGYKSGAHNMHVSVSGEDE